MSETETKSRYADLIQRLEAADGPDRKLDVAIHLAVGRQRDLYREPSGIEYYLDSGDPHYTASTDAALTLCPSEILSWTISDTPGGATATMYDGKFEAWGHPSPGRGNPAIAICIAALRAREALEP